MAFKKASLDKRRKKILKGKIKIPIMNKNSGHSQKKCCWCAFMIKTFYLLPTITKINCFDKKHINVVENVCHDNQLQGDKATFAPHVSSTLKEFVMDNLQLRLFVSQVMVKHRNNIQQVVESSGCFTQNMFLSKQDIRNIVVKVAW